MTANATTTTTTSGSHCHANRIPDQSIVSHDATGNGDSCSPAHTAMGKHIGTAGDTTNDVAARNGRDEKLSTSIISTGGTEWNDRYYVQVNGCGCCNDTFTNSRRAANQQSTTDSAPKQQSNLERIVE